MTFFERVYELVRRIPPGKVATYGQIADLLENPRGARAVGWALNGLQDQSIPWHRVINGQGRVSNRAHAAEQTRRLKREGVRFDGQGRCDLDRYLWDPEDRG
ncbi:MAG: methylated-DNA--[protein]-cysteine S-methyltransferase [Candidatus Eremiobacterota bacterium]